MVETKQGFYKEYTVDKVDDSALDEVRRSYKTADETEEGKNKVSYSNVCCMHLEMQQLCFTIIIFPV